MSDRLRVYCCLSKIQKCKKRLEKKDRRHKRNQNDIIDAFQEFVGSANKQFNPNEDVICHFHYSQIRSLSSNFKESMEKRKVAAIQAPTQPTELRSGRRIGDGQEDMDLFNSPLSELNSSEARLEDHSEQMEVDDTESSLYHTSEMESREEYLQNSEFDRIVPQSQAHFSSPEDSQDTQLSVQVSQQSEISSTASSILAFKYIQGTKTTESKCFICDSRADRRSIPWTAVKQAWFRLNFYIPKSNRVCKHHLDINGLFLPDILNQIEATKQGIHVKSYDFGLWLHEVSDVKKTSPYSFDNDGISEDKYPMWTGLKKSDFDNLLTSLLPEMRNTSTRSIRNGLAMFLILLRTNLKQEAIGDMFGVSQQVVSQIIDTVSSILEREFVPKNLGYHHLTRDEGLAKHCRRITSRTMKQSEEKACVVIDATYGYIESPKDFELQRKTWSAHKKRNLLKIILIVFPSGYILEAAGMYYCDLKNNDAANIKHHYENSDILLFFEEDDYILWDRGYRDAIAETEANNVKTFMPALLPKTRKQFTCKEANDSRLVTLTRWVVEAVNGRLKNVFPFFKHMIEGSYVPKLRRFFRIACALLNKYFPGINTATEFHEVLGDEIEAHTSNTNELKEEVDVKGLRRMTPSWRKASSETILDFPKLTWQDLKILTKGSYQLTIAQQYIKEHQDPSFGIHLHRDAPDLVRAQIKSRFSGSKSHNIWVKYAPNENGLQGILGYYCSCKTGKRTLGSCSHIAGVIRFLSFDRHSPPIVSKRRPVVWDAIDCAEEQVEESEEEL